MEMPEDTLAEYVARNVLEHLGLQRHLTDDALLHARDAVSKWLRDTGWVVRENRKVLERHLVDFLAHVLTRMEHGLKPAADAPALERELHNLLAFRFPQVAQAPNATVQRRPALPNPGADEPTRARRDWRRIHVWLMGHLLDRPDYVRKLRSIRVVRLGEFVAPLGTYGLLAPRWRARP